MQPSYCNPLNLNYRFQVRGWSERCHREAADPSVVYFRGEYWLFASKSGGYWHSVDLQDWQFVRTAVLPTENYAPDVEVIDGALYFTASAKTPCKIYRTEDPKADSWKEVSAPLIYWDPTLFQDEDGRIYAYWGCSDVHPIVGVEMERGTLQPIGEEVPVIFANSQDHGWERFGENNDSARAPWIEGPWMTKRDGKYYLQYAAPGTEWNIYGDGVYVGERPLGPFIYQAHNPLSTKPGGFITGAGHGSSFQDVHGNFWHIATMRISVKHHLERRLGLFPAGFDEDGQMYCNTSFGDYPTRLPMGKWDPWTDQSPGWMLLSYRKPVTVSSTFAGFPAGQAVNENARDFWSAVSGKEGEWLQVDVDEVSAIHAVQVNFAEHCSAHYASEEPVPRHQYLLEASVDGGDWFVIEDKRRNEKDVPHDYVTWPEAVRARFVRITNSFMPASGRFAIAGFRVFGLGNGPKPVAVQTLTATRPENDALAANLVWQASPGAIGYNVRWGNSPNKLYHSWLVYDQTELCLRCLNRGVKYFFRVDAFNENGVSEGAAPQFP